MSAIVSTAPIADIADNGVTKPLVDTETTVVADTEKKEKKKEKKEKKEKKATLPAKHFKNMTFGYWFLLRLKDNGVISDDAYNTAFTDFLKPFANIADQTSLYESFENDNKMTNKDLKKLIKDFHKPPKVKKEKGVKGRKKKAKNAEDAEDTDMVSRIVNAALNEDSKEEVKPKRKYTRKPKEEAPKEKAPKEEAPKEEAPKEEAPKEEAPKEEAPKEECGCETGVDNGGELVEEEYEEVEEEIETIEFTFKDGFMCLLDINNLVLYDRNTHQPITSHTLQRISLPDNSSMLLDHDKNAYMK